jgi:hypothetical protein
MTLMVCHSDRYEIRVVIPRRIMQYIAKSISSSCLVSIFSMRTKMKLRTVQDKSLTRCDAQIPSAIKAYPLNY